MAQITIKNLHIAGSDLFCDSESYLSELADEEMNVSGGIYTSYWWIIEPPIYSPPIWI
mgnify:CR=1 FL=1